MLTLASRMLLCLLCFAKEILHYYVIMCTLYYLTQMQGCGIPSEDRMVANTLHLNDWFWLVRQGPPKSSDRHMCHLQMYMQALQGG